MDSETKKKVRIRSWGVAGFATEERKRLETAEQVSKRDRHIVGLHESLEKEGGGGRIQSWRVRMDREKEERTG